MDFEKLNNELYFKASHHKFAKKENDFDRGYMKISDWINDLCWYYMLKRKQQDKAMELEFRGLLAEQKEKIASLKASEYKDGLIKAIEDASQ
jgi:hypothetical protein